MPHGDNFSHFRVHVRVCGGVLLFILDEADTIRHGLDSSCDEEIQCQIRGPNSADIIMMSFMKRSSKVQCPLVRG